MKQRGILFSAPMVRALLDGSKTQTRRVVKPQPNQSSDTAFIGADDIWRFSHPTVRCPVSHEADDVRCPYGVVGDRLWVREAYRLCKSLDGDSPSKVGELCLDAGYKKPWAPIQYEADGRRDNWTSVVQHPRLPEAGKLRPGMFMCRWMSRLQLDVVSVRVERLQDISDRDCIAEGAPGGHGAISGYPYNATPLEHYRHVWESINGGGSWETNPWVWAVEFKRVTS